MEIEQSLLDCSMDAFKGHLKGKNIGYLRTLLVYITLAWENLNSIRKDAYKKISENSINMEDEQLLALLSSVYAKMISIEEKAAVLRKYIKRIEEKPLLN